MVNIIKPRTGTSTPGAGDFNAVGEIAIDTSAQALYIKTGASTVKMIGSPAVGSTSIVTTGALDAGSITSGFGSIDVGDATIATTGDLNGSMLNVDNITLNDGSNGIIGHSSDNITIDSDNGIVLDATSASSGLMYKDGGTEILRLHNSSSAPVFQTKVDAKDMIFKQYDGTTVMTLKDNGDVDFGDDIFVGDNCYLDSDSSVFGMGAGTDFTITHDGTTGATIAGNPLSLDSGGLISIDAADGTFRFKDDGTEVMRISNSSGDVTIRPMVDAKDLIFAQRDGTEVARIEDNATFNFVTSKLAINGTAVTSTAAELNILDGVTSTAAELNIMDGVTATAAEINILDGVTGVTAAELSYIGDVTSAIQSQIDGKISAGAVTGITTDFNAGRKVGRDSDNLIDFATTDNKMFFMVAGDNQLVLQNGKLLPVTDDDIDLGSSSNEFKNAYFDGTVTADDVQVVDLTVTGDTSLGATQTEALSTRAITSGASGTGYDVTFHGATAGAHILFDASDNSLETAGAATINIIKDKLLIGGTAVTTTAAELNKLDGVTSTTAELNILDGVTSTAAELNILDGVTSTAAELNILDGVTSTAAELNILDGVTATATELNLIDGGTSRGTTTVASGDGFLHNDGGTMRMTNISKLADRLAGSGISASDGVLSASGSANDSTITLTAGDGLKTGGSFTTNASGDSTITFNFDASDVAGTGLTANGENLDVAAAQTSITSIFATDLKIGEDDQTKIDFETVNQIQVYLNNAKDFTFSENTFTALSGSSIVVPAGGLTIGSTAVSSTAAELNILDGVTATATELNIIDGVTATTAELNILDGVTSTTAELNILDGVTATATELNLIDGVTATTTELNYVDGVTSAIQTQINGKQASLTFGKSSGNALKSEEALTTNDILLMGSSNVKGRTYAELKADLSLEIGTDVQAYDAQLDTLAAMTSGEINAFAALSATEIGIIDGLTATTAELNLLDGTVSATELGFLDGATAGASVASKAMVTDSSGDIYMPDSDKFELGASSDMQLYHDGSNSYIANKTGALKIATETSGIAVSIGHTTSETTVNDNLTVTGTSDVGGTLTASGGITIPAGAPREFSIAGEAITDIKTSSDSASTSDDDLVTAGYVNQHGGGGSTNAAGSDTHIQFNDGGTNFGGSANLIWNDTALKIASTSSGTALLELKSTAATSSTAHGPFLDIRRDVTPSDNHELGRLRFLGDTSTGSNKVYGAVMCETVDVTNGSIEGVLTFEAAISNSNTEIFKAGASTTGGNKAVFPASDNAIDLGDGADVGWQTVTARQFRGHDGSSYLDGATGAAIGVAGTDPASGQSGTFDIQAAGGSIAALNFQPSGGGSDVKYKENIQDYTNGLSFIDSLPTPRTFDWKSNASEINKSGSALGYVAQEIESGVLSSYVSELDCSKWDSTKDIDNYKVVDYVKLERDTLYSLINAVKELSTRVKELESK